MQGSWIRRTATIAVMFAASTLVAGTALAKRDGGRHGHGRLLGHIERGVEQLELSAETKQAVYAVLDEARSERRTLAEQIRAAHEQMRAVLDAPSPALDAVMAHADSIGALETQAKKIELTAVVKVRGLLTDEQWRELRPNRRHRPPADADRTDADQGAWLVGGAKINS